MTFDQFAFNCHLHAARIEIRVRVRIRIEIGSHSAGAALTALKLLLLLLFLSFNGVQADTTTFYYVFCYSLLYFFFGNIKARAHCLINFDFVAALGLLDCGLLWGWGSLKQHSTWMTNRTEPNRRTSSPPPSPPGRARGMASNETKHPAEPYCVQNAQQITLLSIEHQYSTREKLQSCKV